MYQESIPLKPKSYLKPIQPPSRITKPSYYAGDIALNRASHQSLMRFACPHVKSPIMHDPAS